MSEPEVEALVSQKYEIKKRLGKGVSAWGGLGSSGSRAAGSGAACGPARRGLCLRPPGPCCRPLA